MNAMPPAIGQLAANRYRLVSPLAQGGMGSVWVAHDERLERDVALKFIAGGIDHEGARRFRQEARVAAKVRGRNLVHVYDFGLTDEQPFLAMELLVGESFSDVIADRAPVPPRQSLHWLEELCTGLSLVHSAGIVHRDIKPSNLFLAHEGEARVLKLLDFGIARVEGGGSNTATGALLGSPGYMSPEQARGTTVDLRSDLWSVGVVWFELLTGHALFASEHAGDAIARVCHDPIPTPSALNPDLARYDEFFSVALSRQRDERFASAEALLDAFRIASADGASAVSSDAQTIRASAPAQSSPQAAASSMVSRNGPRDLPTASLSPLGVQRDEAVPVKPATYRYLAVALLAGLAGTAAIMLWQQPPAVGVSGPEIAAASDLVSSPDAATPHGTAAAPESPTQDTTAGAQDSETHPETVPPKPAMTPPVPKPNSARTQRPVKAQRPIKKPPMAPLPAPKTAPTPTQPRPAPPVARDPFSGLPLREKQ